MNKIKLGKGWKPCLVCNTWSITVRCYYNIVKRFMMSAVSPVISPLSDMLTENWKQCHRPSPPLFCLLEVSWMTGDLSRCWGQPGILRLRFMEGCRGSSSTQVTAWTRTWKSLIGTCSWYSEETRHPIKGGSWKALGQGSTSSKDGNFLTSLRFQMLPGKIESNAACPPHSLFCFSFGALCRAGSHST